MKKNLLGFGIIEVLVAIAIMSIFMMMMMSAINNQIKEVKSIDEKMITKDLEIGIKNLLLNSTFCECLFRGRTLDTTAAPTPTWNTFPVSIPSAYSQPIPAPPAPCVAGGGNMVPPAGSPIGNTGIKIAGLTMTGILHQSGGYYTGQLDVSFDASSMVRTVKNLSIPMSFSIDTTAGTPNARNFLSCGTTPATTGFVYLNPPIVVTTGNSGVGPPPDFKVWTTYTPAVPAGTKVLIVETDLENHWRVAEIYAQYRQNAASPPLYLGFSKDDDSHGRSIQQGFYPLDPSGTFDYYINAGGDGGNWTIRIVGYYNP